ncbi:sensor domain-containing phosphodiesterase [Lysobacter pythonis]|uniref:Sensor domain-containing phosphodiesterase n=1 Tax=Solilutibacter pythonis TaxID=2483112 RepID=A0A3M2HZR2_9GAMM|nr:GGDEF domain-containing phosphodiesterase [Lysobacter pythonis]RMH93605.1 sensor domain-containing phosphodiesterase [Lysobacter pythonis]
MIRLLWRMGVQVHLWAAMAVVLLAMSMLVGLLLQRQMQMRGQVAEFSRTALQQMMKERLRNRAEVHITQLADSLTNPLYYFDLERIGELASITKRSKDVAYVMVYDVQGRILHDGTGEIATYGRRMQDALAEQVIKARGMLIQSTPVLLDVSAPIMLGGTRLGGVRIGYSLVAAQRTEAAAIAQLDQAVQEISNAHRWMIVALVALILLAVVAVAYLAQRHYIRPIVRMAGYAKSIEEGDYGVKMTSATVRGDEVGDLERAFARMSASVRRHDSEIRQLAFTDPLTHLPNRRSFRERLEARLRHRDPGLTLALMFIDVDDFKRVNDTLGHEAGDRVLVEVAGRIRGIIEDQRLESVEIARFGGDEFVILIEPCERGARGASVAAARLAQRLVAGTARPVEVDDQQRVYLGASIGITLYPHDAENAVTLIRNGDIAMYEAKTAGKHCFRFYDHSMEQLVERRVRMEGDLREAWDRGELTLAYQPVFRFSDKRMVGAEALLRWRHPSYADISPASFVAVAEETGLIEKLGPLILRTACLDAVSWRELDPELFVSVNLSVRQLRDAWLPEQIGQVLVETGLAPDGLHVELTETMVLDEAIDVRGMMRRLRAIGVKLWLDDFGTGFSGLGHLRRFPVDGVKIDRTFVSDILHDADDRALTRAIIGMAQSLGIVTVAEGIEEQGQFDLLRDAGCELAQGYWLGRPMVHEDFQRFVVAQAEGDAPV